MNHNKQNSQEISQILYMGLQKILRTLDFSKTLQGKVPSISVSQMRILSLFNEQEVLHISEISSALGLSIQNVNNIVRRLEDADYVKRTPNKENKRFSDITLTTNGKRKFNSFRSRQLATMDLFFNRLDSGEKADLIESIQRAASILEKASQRSE